MGLRDVADAYVEGLGFKTWGVDWRQKRAQQEAELARTAALTQQTEAQTKLTGVQTSNAQTAGAAASLELQQKLGEIEELRKRGVVNAAAAKFMSEQAQRDEELKKTQADVQHVNAQTATEAKRPALIEAQTNEANADASWSRRRQNSVGQPKMLSDHDGNPVLWNPATGEVTPAPPGLTDATTGRNQAKELRSLSTLDALMTSTESELKNYEAHFKGLERFLPALLDPAKNVAKQAYASKLGALAQLFGRTALQDNRVSNEDRNVYANALGVTSEFLMTIDSGEARRRYDSLRYMMQDYKMKYGSPSSNLQQGAEGSPGEVRPSDLAVDEIPHGASQHAAKGVTVIGRRRIQ